MQTCPNFFRISRFFFNEPIFWQVEVIFLSNSTIKGKVYGSQWLKDNVQRQILCVVPLANFLITNLNVELMMNHQHIEDEWKNTDASVHFSGAWLHPCNKSRATGMLLRKIFLQQLLISSSKKLRMDNCILGKTFSSPTLPKTKPNELIKAKRNIMQLESGRKKERK